MRLLFIDFNLPYLLSDAEYPVGGWAVQLNAWLEGLIRNGHTVGVLTGKGANSLVRRKTSIELIEVYDPKRGIKILKYFYYYIPEIIDKTKKFNPDVIIQACSGMLTGIMALVANKLNKPFVYRVANDMDTDVRIKTRLNLIEIISFKYGLRCATLIVCQNEYQMKNMKNKYRAKLVKKVHNPFSHNGDWHEPLGLRERKYVAWLGVFQKQKNMGRLFEIAQKNSCVEFRIAGMARKNVDEVTSTALGKLEKLKNVKFVGYLSRTAVTKFLAQSICLINTSNYEGFSNTYLEAFSSGTPVIAPLGVDPDDIIVKNKLGFVVKSTEDYAYHIEKIRSDAELFREVSMKCVNYVKENHSPEKLASKLVNMISPLIVC